MLESNNWADYILKADNAQAKFFINYLLHDHLLFPHFSELSWLCVIRILFQFPIPLQLIFLIFFSEANSKKKKDILSNDLRICVNSVTFNHYHPGNESRAHKIFLFFILSPFLKSSKMEKVSATSWHSEPMAHVGGKRKW